jgi:hypothetical protein
MNWRNFRASIRVLTPRTKILRSHNAFEKGCPGRCRSVETQSINRHLRRSIGPKSNIQNVITVIDKIFTVPELRDTSMESETATSCHSKEQARPAANEDIPFLVHPDPLLSARFFADRRGNRLVEPEKRLMLAILEDAIYCFRDNCSAKQGKKKRLFENVKRWLFVSDDWVFGFENICSVLEFNPAYVRKGLMLWKEKELSKHPSASFLEKTKESVRFQVPGANRRMPSYTAQPFRRRLYGLKRR